jgi:small conductance mechanosensitive channel
MKFTDIFKSDYLNYAVLILASLALAFITSYILRKLISIFNKRLSKKLNVDPTNLSFIKNSVSFVLYSGALIYIFFNIPALNSLGTALFASAGIAALVIGFAAQKAFSNIIAGIFILIFRPFSVGDTIEIGNKRKGIVEDITLRHITIKDFENRRIIIPNSIISDETIVNSSIIDEKIRQFIEFGISYDSDIDKATAIIEDEISKHQYFTDCRSKDEIRKKIPPIITRLISLDESSVTIRAYAWAENNDNAFIMKCDVLKSVKQRFDNEGIEIPYPHRTIVYKKEHNS